MAVTTSESLKSNQGQMCARCAKRSPLCQWLDGAGYLCSDCDPRDQMVTVVDEDVPVERGRS